ncbi:unnamed protein product [Dicrocoelium dendriticum]|nr:unnamed protein product [Dicrocoelium dendriticum]
MVRIRGLPLKKCYVLLIKGRVTHSSSRITSNSARTVKAHALPTSKLKCKLARRIIRSRYRGAGLSEPVRCYVQVERLRSVPVKDASMFVKPCSIICSMFEVDIIDSNPPRTSSCAISLPHLPLPLHEYISPSPSRIYDQMEL